MPCWMRFGILSKVMWSSIILVAGLKLVIMRFLIAVKASRAQMSIFFFGMSVVARPIVSGGMALYPCYTLFIV